jgi:hypothetical protein
MEALAFVERDLARLTDEAVRLIPRDSTIRRLIDDVRSWKEQDGDWRRTRERIDERYGYHRYGGNCHIVPNHALIHLALQYGAGDFGRSLMIVNTSGWDTDCNSGNVGCLLGVRGGLGTFAGERDWRGPVADRLYLSSADGGRAVTDAVAEADRLVIAARRLRRLAGQGPKEGARYHFSFAGSVQGWRGEASTLPGAPNNAMVSVENAPGHSAAGTRSLTIRLPLLEPGRHVRAGVSTFVPPEALPTGGYHLEASPSLYGGQTIRASVTAGEGIAAELAVRLYVRLYGAGELPAPQQETWFGPTTTVAPGAPALLEWTLPEGDGRPIFEVGLDIAGAADAGGAVYMDWLDWSGTPRVHWRAPSGSWPASRRAWVDALYQLSGRQGSMLTLVANEGRGMAITGRREWTGYTVSAIIRPHMADEIGLAGYVQGLERYYALLLHKQGVLRLVKRGPAGAGKTEERILAERAAPWELDRPYRFQLRFQGATVEGSLADGPALRATDAARPFREGAMALLVTAGRADVDEVRVF